MRISWNHAQSLSLVILGVVMQGVLSGGRWKTRDEVPGPKGGDHRDLCVMARCGVPGADVTLEGLIAESPHKALFQKVSIEDRLLNAQLLPEMTLLQASEANQEHDVESDLHESSDPEPEKAIAETRLGAEPPTAIQASSEEYLSNKKWLNYRKLFQASEANQKHDVGSDLHASDYPEPERIIAETWLGAELPTAIQATFSNGWHKVNIFGEKSHVLPSSGEPSSQHAPREPAALNKPPVASKVFSLTEVTKNDVLAAVLGPLLIISIIAIFMGVALAMLQADCRGANAQGQQNVDSGQNKHVRQASVPPSRASLPPSKINLTGHQASFKVLGNAVQNVSPWSPRRSTPPLGQHQEKPRQSATGFAMPSAPSQSPITPNWMTCSRAASGLSLPSRLSEKPTVPHLCAELVVPEETECNLQVPDLVARVAETRGRISISDTSGVPVFHCTFNTLRGLPPQKDQDHVRLRLWSAIDGLVFGCCRDARDTPTGQPAYNIFNHADMPFGVLRPTTPDKLGAYSIVTCSGREIIFYKTNEVGIQRAEDETGQLLAMVITSSPRCIRIGPEVDAGLVTLGMLGTDLLESDAKT